MKISKAELIFYNFFLLAFCVTFAALPPSVFSAIKQDVYYFNDVQIEKKFTRIPRLVFTVNNERFSVSCGHLVNDSGGKFCDENFPLNVSNLELVVLIEKSYKKGENISVIKSAIWSNSNQMKTFQIGNEYFSKEIQYFKNV